MKKFFRSIFLFSAFFFTLAGYAENWQKGPSEIWHTRWETAQAAAQKSGKAIYILNTGSDWCGWCTVLKKTVLDNEQFLALAKKHLVLLYLDSPSKKHPMGEKQRQYNRDLVKKFSLNGGVPNAVIVDSDGNKLGNFHGAMPLPHYIVAIYKALKLPKVPFFPSKSQTRDGSCALNITHWGTDPKKINKSLNAGLPLQIAPGDKIFLKVKYRLSKKLPVNIQIEFPDGIIGKLSRKRLAPGKGEFLCSISSRKIYNIREIKFLIFSKKSSQERLMNAVNISFDREKLSPEAIEKEAGLLKRKHEISITPVSWGLSRQKVNRSMPDADSPNLKIPYGKEIFFKLNCKIPEDMKVYVRLGSWYTPTKSVPCKNGNIILPFVFSGVRKITSVPVMIFIEGTYNDLQIQPIPFNAETAANKPKQPAKKPKQPARPKNKKNQRTVPNKGK